MIREILSIVLTIVTIIIVRIIFLLQTIHVERLNRSKSKEAKPKEKKNEIKQMQSKPIVTLIVLGSGGHTTEMMSLQSKLNPKIYSPIIHVIANTDHTSEERILNSSRNIKDVTTNTSADITYRIPRSREVGQSYFTSIFTTLHAFLYAFNIVWKVQPDLVLCNGPGTCLPIVIVAFIMGKWKQNICSCIPLNYHKNENNTKKTNVKSSIRSRTKIIFVESFCRVQHLSLTGKLLYPIVDRFVVHWDELHEKYPKSELVQTFVRR